MTDIGTDTPSSCPQCADPTTYELGDMTVCAMCGHEWPSACIETSTVTYGDYAPPRDSVGNELTEGDTVTIVKDLKVKGGGQPIKVGTKVKSIRLVDGVGDHDIEATVPGFGVMQLKSSVVKKA